MRRLGFLLISCWIGVLLVAGQTGDRKLSPIPIGDIIGAKTFSTVPFSTSPDGKWIAYALNDPKRAKLVADEKYQRFFHDETGTPISQIGCDVWIVNTTTGESKNLTGGKGSSWAPVWSPDSESLAFFSNRSGTSALWLWQRKTGMLRQLNDAVVVSQQGLATPQWSPDSRKVLIPVLPKGLSVEEAATRTAGFQAYDPVKTADSGNPAKVIVYRSKKIPKQLATLDRVSISTNQSAINYLRGYIVDLILVDTKSRLVETVAHRRKPSGFWVSPDGRSVAFTEFRPDVSPNSYDLVVVSLKSKSDKVVAKNIDMAYVGVAVSWAPDGKRLAFVGSVEQTSRRPNRDCYVVPLDGSEPPRKVTNTPHPLITQPVQPPLWNSSGTHLYFPTVNSVWEVSIENSSARELMRFAEKSVTGIVSSSRKNEVWSPVGEASIVAGFFDPRTQRVGFSKVDLSSGRVSSSYDEDKIYRSIYQRVATGDATGNEIFYLAEDAEHSPDVWSMDTRHFSARPVTRTRPELDGYVLGAPRAIEYTVGEQRLKGALVLPAGYQPGRRYPMVVWSYPDTEFGNKLNTFGISQGETGAPIGNAQLLASRGYAVLYATANSDQGTHMQDLARCINSAVDRVIDMGIADPERLGIIGYSHGAYTALAVIVQTTRFKAAVAYAGSGNLTSEYGQMDPAGNGQWQRWAEDYAIKLGGTLWEYRDRYIQNSPVFFLDKVETPLLIIHGANDRAVRSYYADEMFVDLKRLGKEVEYAKYEGEDHYILEYGNKVDFVTRMIDWFDQYLKPKSQILK